MTPELEYLTYAMEKYRCEKGLTPSQVAQLFREQGLSQLVLDNYYLYHIESPTHMIADLDSHMASGVPVDATA